MKIKKINQLVFALTGVLFLFLTPGVFAAGDSWESVGSQDYLSDRSHGTPSLAFHPSNHDLYVAIVEEAKSIQVKHYNNNVWENVGSAITSGELDEPKIAFNPSNEQLYLSYWNVDLFKIVVLRYDGSSWVDVGPHGVASGSDAVLAFKPGTGTPYLAYRDSNVGKLVVKIFNGSAWENVGENGISVGDARHISLAFNPENNNPYVAFEDAGNSEKLGVLKFNGSAWENVGPSEVSNGEATDIDLAFDESTNSPWVVYTDGTAGSILKVKKFDGSSWQDIGDPMGGDSEGLFGQIAFCPSTNTPHIAYYKSSLEKNIAVKKWNGSSWELVGVSGFNSYSAAYLDLGFSQATNEPFLIFEDMPASGPTYNYLGIYKFNKAVSNRPSVAYAKKKNTKRNIIFTFKDLKITTKKAWVKIWLGGKSIKVKTVKRSGDNLKVTAQVKYGKWGRGNYNLRMVYKKKTGRTTHTETWRSQNALSIL